MEQVKLFQIFGARLKSREQDIDINSKKEESYKVDIVTTTTREMHEEVLLLLHSLRYRQLPLSRTSTRLDGYDELCCGIEIVLSVVVGIDSIHFRIIRKATNAAREGKQSIRR